jgi:biopolymer transport protein ExbD
MTFHSKFEQAAMSEINVTPLVDVMLVLLIVFIVTAPLLMQAVRVNLPKTAATAPVSRTRTVQLAIDARGALFIGRRAVPPADLEAALRKMLAQRGAVSVQIHADKNTRYREIARVLAAVQRAGVVKVALVTVPQ